MAKKEESTKKETKKTTKKTVAKKTTTKKAEPKKAVKKVEKVEVEKVEVKKQEPKKEVKKTVTKKEEKKELGFFANVRKEMKKVHWPKGLDVIKYTFAVIVFCLFLGLFFSAIDLIVAFIKGLFV